MKKLLRSLLVPVTIALLFSSSFFVAMLLIGRSNWQRLVRQAEAGSVDAQMMVADAYETGTSYTSSGFLLERSPNKARYWRQKVCASPGQKEYCSKFKR